MELISILLFSAVSIFVVRRVQIRLRLSAAKHPSISGHARISKRLARLVPYYEYPLEDAFATDGAPLEFVERRRRDFERLVAARRADSACSREFSQQLAQQVSDVQFTNAYRVPFQYRQLAGSLAEPSVAISSDGVLLENLDGQKTYDLGGSYGVNLFGYDFYKACIAEGSEMVKSLGPVLGPYHPVVADNAARLCEISGMDEVSFHMSGTEAVMQAVGLARYHTRRRNIVMFCGAYHGWWDGVQPGVGGQRQTRDVFMLKENSADTLKVLATRNDIACVLINPLQALHLNRGASSDAMLLNSDRAAAFDRSAYSQWLHDLREVCTRRGIVMIMDEVFLGFRLGVGGAQAFFGVRADLVTYGKTLGGGMPVGVLCGKARFMKRYRDDAPTDICFARGTFNSHPYVMASMNVFLRHVCSPEIKAQLTHDHVLWDERAAQLNTRFAEADLPLKVHNLSSVWVLTYTRPGRYNWMLQFYLRDQGLMLSWVGTARFIFSHNYTDADFAEVMHRIIAGALRMREAGWWEAPASLTNQSIKKQVFREMLIKRLGRG